ncbi:MAG: hypothetical protein IKM70_03250 [Firmicutes bacterium]|nr:hypothetical protein [Bacillota bacterium]
MPLYLPRSFSHSRRRISWRFFAALIVLLLAAALIATACHHRAQNRHYREFLDALAMRESSDNYTAVNSLGYLGRYQLGGMALQDAGFKDAAGSWTATAARHGVHSKEDFLATPAAQDAAVTAYHRRLCRYIRNYELEEYLGTQYCGVEVTRSGLLAASHLVGAKALAEALASGEPVYDGNRVPASEYMQLLAGYRIGKVWK